MVTINMKHLKKDWSDNVSKVLRPEHLKDLRKSGLEEEIILEARIYSVTSQESKMLLNRSTEVGPGYVIPYPSKNGFSSVLNFKPDEPLSDAKGKAKKYVKPFNSKQQLYVAKKVWAVRNNVKVPLIFTEGEKKALKAVQEGFYAIALSGVYNWLSHGEPIEDFKQFCFKGREVFIAFDSDKYSNPQVLKAEERLAEYLTSLGADVKIIDLKEE